MSINIDELIQKEMERHKTKMEVYMEIKNSMTQLSAPTQHISKGKPSQETIISYAINTIRQNPEMMKVTKIADAMRKDGYEVTKELANTMGKKILFKSGKFKINAETRYWESVE